MNCTDNGHIYGSENKCVFCSSPKDTPATSGSADQAVIDKAIEYVLKLGEIEPCFAGIPEFHVKNKMVSLVIQAAEQTQELREDLEAAKIAEGIQYNTNQFLRDKIGEYQTRLDVCREAVTQAVTENNSLRQRVKKLEGALEKIAKMRTLPDHAANSFTLAIAHGLANEALNA